MAISFVALASNKNPSGAQPEVRVLVVDADTAFGLRLKQLLDRPCGFRLCGVEADHDALPETILRHNPALIMAGFELGAPESLPFVCQLATAAPERRLLGVTRACGAVEAERALRSGARGVLLRSEPDERILKAIKTVMGGELYVSRPVLMPLLRRMLDTPPSFMPAGVEALTDRELRVFELLGCGLRPREIAGQLGVSCRTVESHCEKIRHRLGLEGAAVLLQQACLFVQRPTDAGGAASGSQPADPASADSAGNKTS